MNVATNSFGMAEGMENLEISADRRAVLIAGPTASGKSALAIDLAERLGGVVINADSMQLYRELRILSARPGVADEARVPHRLYGEVPAAKRFSVAAWREAAAHALDEVRAAGKVPIIVGGTGLYFKALTEGLAAIPPIPEPVRARIADRADAEGVPALHAALAVLDPVGAARLQPGDRTRVLRALEVVEVTGRPISHWQETIALPRLIDLADAAAFVLEPERPVLHERIGLRFDAMVAAGALDEVRALLALGLDADLPAMKAIGVREFRDHLEGRSDLAAAIERAKMETRRYAKRQSTWFRHQMPGWRRITAPAQMPDDPFVPAR